MMNLSRRQFLLANGAALALPSLPSMANGLKDHANKPQKKLVMMYVPNGLVRRCFFPGEEEGEIPGFVGGFNAEKVKDKRIENVPGIYNLELTSTMAPLANNIDDITLVTGMDRTYKNGQDVHAQASSCYMTSISPDQAIELGMRHPNGRTLDHIIGDHISHTTTFKTLEISCNGYKDPKESPEFDNISWYGEGKFAPSIKDPKKLYNRLFMADDYRKHVTDVTDLIRADAKTLEKRLGRDDRETFGEFLEAIRSIEVRIARLQDNLQAAHIKEPTDADLPRGEYIQLMGDLMLLALQMGITNVSTFMVGPERWDAPLSYEGVFDKPVQHHNMTHNQKGDGYKDLQKIDIFHMQQYSYILSKMKAIKESDGSSLFDNSIITYGAGIGDGATHQYFDLPLIVAGKAQGQIKQGRFIKCKSGTLNSNMWLTIAQLMGLEIDQYSDSTGTISELLS